MERRFKIKKSEEEGKGNGVGRGVRGEGLSSLRSTPISPYPPLFSMEKPDVKVITELLH